ncbi:hypothetical protein [Exiguobacterium sp. s146]|uniref:hypothetical protein n=1 Tax=Exiguobacterium sp. s146 TaxID=2751223 RepID=UPI001BE6CD33|nr:hypothetical protein [Exiguobacterium sp. s146]
MSRTQRKQRQKFQLLIRTFILVCLVMAGVIYEQNQEAEADGMLHPSTSGSELRFSGMALRLDPQGLYIHANGSHKPLGFTQAYIEPTRGYIVVRRDRADSVVSIIAEPDETLTKRGITIGASGGGTVTHLFVYQNGVQLNMADPVDYAKTAGVFSNIWMTIISQSR